SGASHLARIAQLVVDRQRPAETIGLAAHAPQARGAHSDRGRWAELLARKLVSQRRGSRTAQAGIQADLDRRTYDGVQAALRGRAQRWCNGAASAIHERVGS